MYSERDKLIRSSATALANGLILILGLALVNCTSGHVAHVKIDSDSTGHKLTVDGTDYFVKGMNWDYYPIGTNYKFILWEQPDDFIIAVLEDEMSALKAIHVNTIRQYAGVPPRWVKYIYDTYGIFTILNHPFARYGIEVDGKWIANVDYGDAATREVILLDVIQMIEDFRYVPGVLMWLLGNENNYGLSWKSAATKNIPDATGAQLQQARDLYSLFNEAIRIIHIRDNHRPVAMANGDTQFIELIAEEIENLDIFGANVYRGASFEDLFQEVHDKLGLPLLPTEFGADAFQAVEMREDQESQAEYLFHNWREIYTQAKGQGSLGNSLGGCTFQFSDGWWKSGPDDKLDIHDSHASWSNGGYHHDFIPGQNNMNEEWFGVCAKEPTTTENRYKLQPRQAYYVLQAIQSLDPLASQSKPETIQAHFSSIGASLIDSLPFQSETPQKMNP